MTYSKGNMRGGLSLWLTDRGPSGDDQLQRYCVFTLPTGMMVSLNGARRKLPNWLEIA